MRRNAAWLLALVTALAACSRPDRAPTNATASPSAAPSAASSPTPVPIHAEMQSRGDRYVTVVQQVHGRTVYQLRALSSRGDVSGSSNAVVSFERPHITFHDRQGKTLVADAPEARVTQRDKSVLMSGGVRARGQDGSVLTCDRLRYDGGTEKLHGEGHVNITGPNNLSLSGDVLDGDVRLDDVRISRGAR